MVAGLLPARGGIQAGAPTQRRGDGGDMPNRLSRAEGDRKEHSLSFEATPTESCIDFPGAGKSDAKQARKLKVYGWNVGGCDISGGQSGKLRVARYALMVSSRSKSCRGVQRGGQRKSKGISRFCPIDPKTCGEPMALRSAPRSGV